MRALAIHAALALGTVLVPSLGGCSGAPSSLSSQSSADGGFPGDATPPSVDASQGEGSPPGDASSLSAAVAAAQTAAANDANCAALPSFYWEVGDVSGAVASGKVGTDFDATTAMNIASASKLVFGAYVVERFKSDLSQMDANAMRMLSGYVSLADDSCAITTTVSACLDAGNNATLTAADVGRFDYNGGHFQKYAVDLGLGADDDSALTADVKTQVGTEFAFTYVTPQLAGGIRATASDYAAFLRKILRGDLAIRDHLGEDAVCTKPSTCPTAVYSPAPAAWHYSYGHWVEDDPTTGDGSFSSPGKFGFYPWIDKTKTYYGIVARDSHATQAYVQSAECGAAIRKAFMAALPGAHP